MILKRNLLAGAVLLALGACGTQTPTTGASAAATEAKVSGVDMTALDTQVRPQDDFYQFANGGWLDNTEIPKIYSGYTIYHQVYEDAEKSLLEIIKHAAASQAKPGTEAQKVGDTYAGWMDTANIEAKGLTPLEDELQAIAALKGQDGLVELFAQMIRDQQEAPLGMYVSPDLKDSSQYAVYFYQSGLTLPNRDYYLDKDNQNFANIREQLPAFIQKMLSFTDAGMTLERANAVYRLEHKIAEHQWSQVENRDDEKTYNPYKRSELPQLGKHLQWQPLMAALGLDEVNRVIIGQPSYFSALDTLIAETPLTVWQDYLSFHLVLGYAGDLPAAIDSTAFEFMGQKLQGQSEQTPRWKRGVGKVNGALGEAVGKLYVEQRFPAKAKEKMTELVNNVLAVFDDSIDKLDWMSEATRKAAKLKRSQFTTKIGYPDVWRDYSALTIVPGDHLGNMQRVHAFDYQRQLDKLGNPIDKNEWFMTPQTVNAYYDPTKNEIVFPAARLQQPFFQLDADDAINYGAIGGVIGHEISHGFDDSGSKYDGRGNLHDWWTKADRAAFEARTQRLVEQYNQFSPIEGMTVNGELTLGENIGDLSGVTMAYRAYIRSLKGKKAPVINGFTGPQRFFIGYAMSRKGKYKRETTVSRLASDPHSPLQYRVNGVYRNLTEFQQAFDVKPGDGMYLAPEDRVQLW
ncbi:M13 family metallopeptidase [Shewanella salipaludis]|uniref:M13 family metallopeptidase n=1 Tax=Shewanella salipaludis TaxID=2723052 RepID=A0A972JL03_9GAMM|nr:M13 family metallopeptidase [Shewanella salipaludis]NMH64912.1 M13 family metallopeptidase [Shewanella salipaludis]